MIETTSEIGVELIQHMGGDESVVFAARVSTGTEAASTPERDAGLIGYLMRNLHGTPFEHATMTFRVSAPVVVWWEHVRHRVGFSYNLESGRYKELEGKFFIPAHARKQTGKPGHYQIVDAPELDEEMRMNLLDATYAGWYAYQRMLGAGIANEVARLALTFNLFYSGYVTCNPRSLMAFMSLRTVHEDARYPSKPQQEIRMLGDEYEAVFQRLFPETHRAWQAAGRVAP